MTQLTDHISTNRNAGNHLRCHQSQCREPLFQLVICHQKYATKHNFFHYYITTFVGTFKHICPIKCIDDIVCQPQYDQHTISDIGLAGTQWMTNFPQPTSLLAKTLITGSVVSSFTCHFHASNSMPGGLVREEGVGGGGGVFTNTP